MATVFVYVILEPKKIKSVTVSIISPSICHEVMGPDAMILAFLMLNFKLALKLTMQKTEIMISSPITSWQTEGGKVSSDTCSLLGLQNHCGW